MNTNGRSSISDRAGAPLAAVDPQEGLFDQVLEDPALSEALEKREKKRVDAAYAKGEYDIAADVVKGKLDALDLHINEKTVLRCGRFKITISPPGDSSHVEYDTTPRRNTTITMLD